MSVIAAVSQEEQHAYIKIEYLRGKTGIEIYENLIESCGTSSVSLKTAYRWLERFSAGKTDILDKPRCGRPVEVINDYHVENIKGLLDEDRRYTCEELAESIGISHGCNFDKTFENAMGCSQMGTSLFDACSDDG